MLLRIFSIVSFKASIASVTFVVAVNDVYEPSPNVESVGVDNSCVIPLIEDPELDSAATESSTYFLVDASEFAAGSPTSIFASDRFEKSVTVDPSCVVVPTLNLSLVSSQMNRALFSVVLFIIIPASVADEAFSLSVIILSSTTKFCESMVVVEPCTIKSPVTV